MKLLGGKEATLLFLLPCGEIATTGKEGCPYLDLETVFWLRARLHRPLTGPTEAGFMRQQVW